MNKPSVTTIHSSSAPIGLWLGFIDPPIQATRLIVLRLQPALILRFLLFHAVQILCLVASGGLVLSAYGPCRRDPMTQTVGAYPIRRSAPLAVSSAQPGEMHYQRTKGLSSVSRD
jgi:hypothetical protein